MSESNVMIACPQCGYRFNAEQALEEKLHRQIEQEFESKMAQQAERLNELRKDLESEKAQLQAQAAAQDEVIKARIEQERTRIENAAGERAQREMADRLQQLEKDNAEKNKENRKFRALEVDLMAREKKLAEQAEEMELAIKRQLLAEQGEIEKKARRSEQEKIELRMREYEKKLSDQKNLIDEMKRKAEQGSMQMQGEVQELVLEELLVQQFPLDRVEEVPKGVRGADLIHTVFDDLQQRCGSIVYESKRTKHFGADWIAKLKEDQLDQGADIAVLVTQTMPSNLPRFGQIDGVWVCSFTEFKSLVVVLREMLLKLRQVASAEENKGDKMEMLYAYLTGAEFRQRVETIVEGFTDLQTELDREQRAMRKIWKAREKQIEKILNNTIDMYGAVKGIAGQSIASIPSLELPLIQDASTDEA
jgi:hypothetical protein